MRDGDQIVKLRRSILTSASFHCAAHSVTERSSRGQKGRYLRKTAGAGRARGLDPTDTPGWGRALPGDVFLL
ncbi:hypothetical protein GN956_G25490 [Arapaima gigas]